VYLYIAHFLQYLALKALGHGSHSVTCNYTNVCLYLVCVHQMAPLETEVTDNYTNVCLYLVCVHQMAPPETEVTDI